MVRATQLKTNFVAGEFDPLLLARSDVQPYYNAGERVRNAIVIPQGGVSIRPGSRFLWSVPDGPGGNPSNVRLASFTFNTEQTYLIAFHHQTITIFRNDVIVATVPMAITSDQLNASFNQTGDLISSGIYWTQSKDTMLIFHDQHPVMQLRRGTTHTSWTLSPFTFRNVPRFDFGETYTAPDEIGVNEVQSLEFPNPGSQGDWTAGDTFRLILEGEESTNIAFATSSDTMRDNIQAALRGMPNTSADGITVTHNSQANTVDAVFTVTFGGDDGGRPWGATAWRTVSAEQIPSIDIIVTTDGQFPGEVVWSAARGYPRCGAFFQGRLWMAGTPDLPHFVWASRSGDPQDFNTNLTADDYGIAVPADTSDVPAFTAIHAGRHLQLFSTSAEFYVPASDAQAVTPNNVALRRNTDRGIKAGLRVHEVDGATLFVQRRGNALREMIFTDVELAYQTNNISLFSSHLIRDPIDFTLRRSTSTTDADYLFMCNDDGTMTVFCTLRTQNVNAMTLWQTQGSYKAAVSVLGEVYFAVERTINGNAVVMIERMDDTLTVDSGMTGGVASSLVIPHLPGTEIEILLDGAIQEPITSGPTGFVNFPRLSDEGYQVGLKFAPPDPDRPDLIWLCKTLPIELQLPEGSTLGKKRRIVRTSVRLHETSALIVNNNRLSFQQFGASILDRRVVPETGVRNIRGMLGWDFDGSVTIGSDQSLPATVLGLSFGVSI